MNQGEQLFAALGATLKALREKSAEPTAKHQANEERRRAVVELATPFIKEVLEPAEKVFAELEPADQREQVRDVVAFVALDLSALAVAAADLTTAGRLLNKAGSIPASDALKRLLSARSRAPEEQRSRPAPK